MGARGFAAAAVVGAVLTAIAPAAGALAAQEPGERRYVLFGAEGNRFNAYDVTGAEVTKQTVIPSAADDPQGGRDINAQICFNPDDPTEFIAGEDTDQTDAEVFPGWGYFRLDGEEVGSFGWEQIGKMIPTYQASQSNPENYGCGFLSDGRVVTTDIGDQYPGFPANGQLIVWFPPLERYEIPYCKIDVAIPTAGQILVEDDDSILVASARESALPLPPRRAGIYRYSGDWPTGPDAAGGCGRTDTTGAPLVDDGRITRELFIGEDEHATTPNAVVAKVDGSGYYVSSVFNGVIAEYDNDGNFVGRILEPPPEETGQLPYSSGTPLGLAIDSRGTLYFADIGIVLGPPPGPGDGTGSERRIIFQDGEAMAPETFDEGLAFPDALGIREFVVAQPTESPSPTGSPTATATATPSVTPTSTATPTASPSVAPTATSTTPGGPGGPLPTTGAGALGAVGGALAATVAALRQRRAPRR